MTAGRTSADPGYLRRFFLVPYLVWGLDPTEVYRLQTAAHVG